MIVDGHSDVLIDVVARHKRTGLGSLRDFHLPRWKSGGVVAALCPITVDTVDGASADLRTALDNLEIIEQEIAYTEGQIVVARSKAEAEDAIASGGIAVFLGMEGAMPLGGDPEVLSMMYDLGLRWMGLTWNAQNELGDGLAVAIDTGLTDAGHAVVLEMARLGMVADLTHASPKTFFDAMGERALSVIASHSNAQAICQHVRNLTDDQIRAVATRGGVVGVNFFPSLVSHTNPSIHEVIRHFEYLVALVGHDHVGVGADYIDFSIEDVESALAASGIDYGASLQYPAGLEDTTKLPRLVAEFENRDWTREAIVAVSGGNFLRMFSGSNAL